MNRFIVFFANTDNLCPAVATPNVSDLTAAQLADFVRTLLRRYISHKYTRGSSALIVYLLGPAIERRVGDIGAQPLSEDEEKKMRGAIHQEIGDVAPTAVSPVILTTFETRRPLKKTIEHEFPRLAVLNYQEVSPEMNIQPIGRISWD